MMIAAFCIKALAVTALVTMSKTTSGLEKELDVRSQAFSVDNNHTETILVNHTAEIQMLEPNISLPVAPTMVSTPSDDLNVTSNNNKTIETTIDPAMLYALIETFPFPNQTINTTPSTVPVNETETMEPATIVPSFFLNVSPVDDVNHFESITETIGNDVMEPAIGLVVDLFRSTSQVVGERFNDFLADLPVEDLFESFKTKFHQAKDLFDSAFGYDQGTISHFSSAPMVTGNLTGSALVVKAINNTLPATGCTVPFFSLDYILEKEVAVVVDQHVPSPSFVEEFLMAPSRRTISLASGVLDTISVDFYLGFKDLETFVVDTLANPSAAGDMVVKTVSNAWEQAYKKVERKATDLLATAPPPTLEQALQREAITLAKRVDRKIRQCQRTKDRVEMINGWLPRPVAVAYIQFLPEVKCVMRWL